MTASSTTAPHGSRPDTVGLQLQHRILTRDLVRLTDVVQDVAAGRQQCTRRRAVALDQYVQLVCDALHHHHATEDDVLWPVLESAVGPHLDLSELREDHDDFDLEGLRAAARAFARKTDELTATALGLKLAGLRDQLVEHLEDEERIVLPLVVGHVSLAQWDTVERAARGSGLPMAFEMSRAWDVSTHEERVRLVGAGQVRLLGLLLPLLGRGFRRQERLVFGG